MKGKGKEMLEAIIENYGDEHQFLIADGFDDAVIGCENNSLRIIYSYVKCVEILMERDGMSHLECVEHMDFNVLGAYVGDKTPIWCMDDLIF